MERDFNSVTTRDALRIAIPVEERNAHVYRRLGDIFSSLCHDSSEVYSAFYALAKTEDQHGALLTARYGQIFGEVQSGLVEEELESGFETPLLNIADILAAIHRGDRASARRKAFEIAVAAEQSAVAYYTHLVKTTSDVDLKCLYQELVAFEKEHTERLESELIQTSNPCSS